MSDSSNSHNDLIREQFTRQAVPFAQKPEHSHAAIDRIVLEAAEFHAGDLASVAMVRTTAAERPCVCPWPCGSSLKSD